MAEKDNALHWCKICELYYAHNIPDMNKPCIVDVCPHCLYN